MREKTKQKSNTLNFVNISNRQIKHSLLQIALRNTNNFAQELTLRNAATQGYMFALLILVIPVARPKNVQLVANMDHVMRVVMGGGK